jgi:hypothetical protein
MATATKTWDFTTGTLGWSFAAVATETGVQNGTNGLTVSLAGKNLTASEISAGATGWSVTGTYESIWGIPSGSTVTQIALTTDSVDWLCSVFTTGVAGLAHKVAANNTGTEQMLAGASYSTTTTRATVNLTTVQTVSEASSTSRTYIICTNLATGASNSAVVTVGYPKLVLTITYTSPTNPPHPVYVDSAVDLAASR